MIFQYTNFQMCKIYELWSLFLYHFEIYIMYDLYIYELRSFFCEKDTLNKLGYKAKINTHTTSYIN